VALVRARASNGALVAIAATTAAACAFLVPVLGECEAFALIGLAAGFIGYAVSRHFPPEPPTADYSPRVLLPTPGVWALLVALAFVVAAIIGQPSPVGWLVLAVGGFGLVLAAAFIRQERRIAELEARVRSLEAERAARRWASGGFPGRDELKRSADSADST
jgi:hypothetical protein